MTILKQPSPFHTVYCLQCHRLLLDAPTCPNGDWQRPSPDGQKGQLIWQTQLDGQIGKPYVAGVTAADLYVIPVEKGTQEDPQVTLVALHDQSGAVAWSRPLAPRRIARSLVVDDGRLFASHEHLSTLADAKTTVEAIDVRTGESVSQAELSAHSHSAPARMGDLLIFSASNHCLHAFNAEAGTPVWQSAPLPSWTPFPPLLAAGRLFVGGYTHVISSVDETGEVAECFRAPEKGSWFDLPLVSDGHAVYAACSDKHLYAIDAASGKVRWSRTMGRGFTAPPAVGDHLYVPLKTYQKGEYLVRAVSPSDGQTVWQFAADSHLLTPPVQREGTLFCSSRKGTFYALDAATGIVQWQVETGDVIRTAAATCGAHVLFGTSGGTVTSVIWRDEAAKPLRSAGAYRDEQEWLLAGTAAARAGRWRAAADDFARGGLADVAAQLYARAGAWEEAAPLFLEAGILERARQAYEQVGDRHNVAEVHLLLQQPEQAADLFTDLGEFERAATLYHETGQLARAAAYYTRAGNNEEALKLYGALEQFAEVAKLARELGHHLQEAEASLALARQFPAEDYLHYRAAAFALVRAAQQHASRPERTLSDEALADLWQQAADYFDEGMVEDEELIAHCRTEVLRWRGWPKLALDVQAERKLAVGRWDGLIVRIKNVGFGVARHVTLKVVESDFDGRHDTQAFSGILPEHTEQIRLNVRPRSAGSSVPLAIQVQYTRPDGQQVGRVIHATVPVHDRDSQEITSEKQIGQRSPIQLHQDAAFTDEGDRYQPIIIQGDYYSVGQVSGSAVAIGRESGSTAADSAPEADAEGDQHSE